VGIRTLRAGRDLGSRKPRADAILDFALEHPEAVTAENSLLSRFLLQKTRSEVKTTNENNAPRVTPKPAPAKPKPAAVALAESVSRSPNRVFVVHGHNEKARSEVIAYLASLGLEGVVLHEQPNMGRHLLTKFLEEARLVTFAVVLMTDDDLGSAKDGKPLPRARQNVILELGYFIAYLGQAKVCALITPGLETPSDFDGIAYIKMAEDEKWKAELLRELRAAEMPLLLPTKK
jgi:predicted nucleotide-binding protein